jgi:hypothetical protein
LAALVAMALLTCGCATEEHVVNDPWGWFKNIQPAGETSGATASAQVWTIAVLVFDGPDHANRAAALVGRLAHEVDLPNVWFRDDGERTMIYCGHYPTPNSPLAQSDLVRTRQVTLDGKRIFGAAELVPIGAALQAATTAPQNPWDLRRYPGMYTLQIGFYDGDYGKGFRAAAEEAVRVLRGDGQEAYYYHGPNRSMVCLGLFNDDDFVRDADGDMGYGPRVRQLQQQFPYNLGNGVTVLERRPGQQQPVAQPSFLVRTSLEMR